MAFLKRNKITYDEGTYGVDGLSFAPPGLCSFVDPYPRLTPWAVILRRFAAAAHKQAISRIQQSP